MVAILFPVWLGQRYGVYVRKKTDKIEEGPISSAVGGALGLFAFMLAFTFQVVGNRYDQRRELMLDEIGNIRTTYLNAGLVPEPFRTGTRKMLVEYVDIRVMLYHDPGKLKQVGTRSQQILDTLWNYSEALAAQDRSSEAYSLFISSVTGLVELFNQRIAVALQMRLPAIVLYILAIVAFFSMIILGFQFGISGKLSFVINLLLGVTFAAVMWLIFALDRPESGLIQSHLAPLVTLQEQLHHR